MKLGQWLNFVTHSHEDIIPQNEPLQQKERLTWKPEKCKEQVSPLS